MSNSRAAAGPGSSARASGSVVQTSLATGRLRIRSIVYFVVSAAAPLTVTAASAAAAWAATGIAGLPLAYLLTGIPLALFAVGYTAMSRHIVNAGAFYSFIARGLGRATGLPAALAALVAYCSLQISLYGGLGVVAAGFAAQHWGASAPWWVYSLGAWAVVACCGLARITVSTALLSVLLAAECGIIAVYLVAELVHAMGTGTLGWAGLSWHLATGGGVVAFAVAGVIAVSGYTGFEDSANYSEEARDPRRTVRAATYVGLAGMVVLYTAATWLTSLTAGAHHVVHLAVRHGTELLFVEADRSLPDGWGWLITTGHLLLVTSLLACAIAFHNSLGRYAYALGRERALPAAYGYTWARTRAPITASLTQTGLAGAAIVLVAATGADPLIQLGFWLGSLAGLGVMALMGLTCLAVIVYFRRDRAAAAAETAWRTTAAPAAGFVLLAAMVTVTVTHYATVLGVAPGDPLTWIFPAVYAVAIVAGLARAAWMRLASRETYLGIGYGAEAATRPNRPSRWTATDPQPAEG